MKSKYRSDNSNKNKHEYSVVLKENEKKVIKLDMMSIR